MTRRYRQRAGTWGAAANGCGACGTFPAPAADRSPRRGHLKAERSDGAARNGTAGQGGGGGHPPGGEGGPGWAVAPPPPGSRPPAERGRQETCGGCARSEEPTGRPLQGAPSRLQRERTATGFGEASCETLSSGLDGWMESRVPCHQPQEGMSPLFLQS
ncbi:uncharacterized protein PRD47_002442 isoform 1-T1 [Ara ararauna]